MSTEPADLVHLQRVIRFLQFLIDGNAQGAFDYLAKDTPVYVDGSQLGMFMLTLGASYLEALERVGRSLDRSPREILNGAALEVAGALSGDGT